MLQSVLIPPLPPAGLAVLLLLALALLDEGVAEGPVVVPLGVVLALNLLAQRLLALLLFLKFP